MPKSMLMLTLILIAGFKTCNGTKPNVLTKSSITMNKPTTSTLTLAGKAHVRFGHQADPSVPLPALSFSRRPDV